MGKYENLQIEGRAYAISLFNTSTLIAVGAKNINRPSF